MLLPTLKLKWLSNSSDQFWKSLKTLQKSEKLNLVLSFFLKFIWNQQTYTKYCHEKWLDCLSYYQRTISCSIIIALYVRNEVIFKMKWGDCRATSNQSNLMDVIYTYVSPCRIYVYYKGDEDLNIKECLFVCIYIVNIYMWFWPFKIVSKSVWCW